MATSRTTKTNHSSAPEPIYGINVECSKRFLDLLANGEDSDVDFIIGVGAERVQAHKLILKTASPYFRHLLGEMSGDIKRPVLSFSTIEMDVFMRFLKFIYAGEICQDIKFAIPLLNAARFFQVPDLERHCITLLKNSLSEDDNNANAFVVFEQALQYGMKNWVQAAGTSLSKIAHKFVESPQFLEMSVEEIEALIMRDKLAVENELQLFEALLRWAEAECKRQGTVATVVTPKHCRSVLDTLIPHIRFPQIEPGDFALQVVSREGVLTTEEIVSVLLYRIPAENKPKSRPPVTFNAAPRQYWVSAIPRRRVTLRVQQSKTTYQMLQPPLKTHVETFVKRLGCGENENWRFVTNPHFEDEDYYYNGYNFNLICVLNENSIPALIAKIEQQTRVCVVKIMESARI